MRAGHIPVTFRPHSGIDGCGMTSRVKGFLKMMKDSTRFLMSLACALIFSIASSSGAAAQEQKKEEKGKASSTVEAWRQALPPETETERPPAGEEGTNGAPAPPSREEVEQSLLALERRWMEALRTREASTLGQLIADDFLFVMPGAAGSTQGNRDKYLGHALRELKISSYEFEGQTVRLYGRTAIVSGRLTQKATGAGGEDLSGGYLLTDVWVRQDGLWRIVSHHASRLPATV